MSRIVVKVAGAIIVVVVVVAAYFYVQHDKKYPATDDAYVGANVVNLAAGVGGEVVNVPVSSYQFVEKGQLLLEIDPQEYQLQVVQALAKYKEVTQGEYGEELENASVREQAASARLMMDQLQQEYDRIELLIKQGFLAETELVEVNDNLEEAKTKYQVAQAELQNVLQQTGQISPEAPKVVAARARLDMARLNLFHTRVYAPVDGYLGKVELRPGAFVVRGRALFPLVDKGTFWVDANYKEGDLERIKPGQSAKITLDMYPGKTFNGEVVALSPASGAAFSLLPPENATGNWVKISQRFPIRVNLQLADDSPILRIGSSAAVRIDATEAGM